MCRSSACSPSSPRFPPSWSRWSLPRRSIAASIATSPRARAPSSRLRVSSPTLIVGERLQAMHGEVLAVAYELARAKPLFDQDRDKFHKFLTQQAGGRGLSAVLIFTPDGQIVDRADIPIAAQPAAAECGSAQQGHRDRGADRADPGRRRRHHQAVRLRQHVSLRRRPARPARSSSSSMRPGKASPNMPIWSCTKSAFRSRSR